MAIFRGFVQTVEVRGDGWCEAVLEAVHAGNATQTFFIPNVDGDLTQTNKRLGQLSLLRDALARVLPVEIDYTGTKDQGNLIDDVIIHPRPSIDGRAGTVRYDGVVIGLSVTELGPQSGSSPYLDAPDIANAVLLTDAGDVVGLLLDLQRPDPLTAQSELRLLRMAYRTRRPVEVLVSDGGPGNNLKAAGGPSGATAAAAYIQSTRFLPLAAAELNYAYAFLERLGQRYESYTAAAAPAISHVKVVYTTAPGQTPEGDVSNDGSFAPQRLTAWVHDDSPLLARLEAALRDSLQVKLGLSGDQVHEVELVSHLGSAARPIWIVEDTGFCAEKDAGTCTNVPTIQGPGGPQFANLPRTVTWSGKGYFQEGIWRFNLASAGGAELKIDGKAICCSTQGMEHAYLKGMHCVELVLPGVTCASSFTIQIYRIR